MARIAGIDLPREKRVEVGLSIYHRAEGVRRPQGLELRKLD